VKWVRLVNDRTGLLGNILLQFKPKFNFLGEALYIYMLFFGIGHANLARWILPKCKMGIQ
jgi:hypothetical protein